MARQRDSGNGEMSFLHVGGEGAAYYQHCLSSFAETASAPEAAAVPAPVSAPPHGAGTHLERSESQRAAQKLASLSSEEATRVFQMALQAIPTAEKMRFNIDLATQLKNPPQPASLPPNPGNEGTSEARGGGGASTASVNPRPPPPEPATDPQKRSRNASSSKPSKSPSKSPSKHSSSKSHHYAERNNNAVRVAVTEVVKKYLRKPWEEKKLTREAFKAICKKTVEQIVTSDPPVTNRTLSKQEIKAYLSPERCKTIKNLVEYQLNNNRQ